MSRSIIYIYIYTGIHPGLIVHTIGGSIFSWFCFEHYFCEERGGRLGNPETSVWRE